MATHMDTRAALEDAAFTETYRDCRNATCNHQQRRDEFCCPACWRALPGYLRDAVWSACRARFTDPGGYQQAKENATAFLEDREAITVRWRP